MSVAEVTGWRDEHPHNTSHVPRWNEVLAALGGADVPAGVSPLTVAESRANERRFSPARWVRVTTTARYAHLARDTERASAVKVGGSIGADILGNGKAVRETA